MVVQRMPSRPMVMAARRSLLASSALLALAAVVPKGVMSLRQTVDSDLLVRGEAAVAADGAIAWRVVQDVAEPTRAAAFERRALGFAVNTSLFDAILVTDEATGTAFRLGPGGALFTPDGVSQRRESVGPDPVAYLRIALVAAASAGDAGGDRLRFAGPPFALPADGGVFTLHRIALEPGDTADLTIGGGDALVLVEQGEATLDRDAGTELLATTVGSETAYAIRSVAGVARLIGARQTTTVLVATIE